MRVCCRRDLGEPERSSGEWIVASGERRKIHHNTAEGRRGHGESGGAPTALGVVAFLAQPLRAGLRSVVPTALPQSSDETPQEVHS